MKDQTVVRDERTDVVENASYRIAYMIMTYGLLAIVVYRGFFLQQSNWDLLALVVLGSAAATLYQGAKKVLPRRWIVASIVTFIVSGLIAVALVVLLR